MQEIQNSNKQIGDSQKLDVGIFGNVPGIPGNHKHAASHDDAAYFHKGMEQKIRGATDEV